MLKLLVKGQKIELWEREVIAEEQIAFASICFVFSDSWKGLDKTVQFTQEDSTYHVHLGCDMIAHCFIPAELQKGLVQISVFGYAIDGSVRATTVPMDMRIHKSGFSESGSTPIPPTPDLYAQLLQQLDEKAASLENGKDGASAYELAIQHGFSGTEEQWLASLQGEKGDTGADGFSPTATVVKSGSVVTITITDRNGTTTASMTESTDVDLTEVNASIATLQATVSDSQIQLQKLTDNYINYTGSTNNAIDALETLSHAHENKDLLDRITTPQHVHWHSNITVLQTITQDMLNGMMDASRQKHVHVNKTVLDNITEEKTKVWDEKANTQDIAKVQDQLNILKDSYTNNCIRVDGNIGKLQQFSHSHEAVTIYVNATAGSDSNDGSTTAKAFATLEKALKAVGYAKKATIRLAAGTYTIPNKTITLTSSYLAIVGASQSDTIVKGNLNLDNSYLKLFDISLDCTDSEYADTSAEAPIHAMSNSSVHLVRTSIYTATKYCISATEISNVYCYNASFSGCTSYSIMLTGGTSATIYGSADISTKGLCSGYGCRTYLVNNSYFTYKSTNYGLVYLNGQQVLPQTAETAAVLSMGGNV